MYFRWKDRRIVTKVAVWAAREGGASQFLYTLADAVGARVASGELEEPDTGNAVGIPRNDEPIEIDESDRRFGMYFCRPTGDAAQFAGHPVDYKLLAPTAPVEGNRAFRTTVEGASAMLFLASSGAEDANADALSVLADRVLDDAKLSASDDTLASKLDTAFGGEDRPLLRVLLPPQGSDAPDPEAFRRRHHLPDRVTVESTRPWNADDAWHQFLALADSLEPAFERALRDGRIPDTDFSQ
jgi:hypothetical protein